MKDFGKLANESSIQKAVEALRANGIEAVVVENGVAAKEKVLELLPKGAEVMTMASQTLEEVGIVDAINESSEYNSVKTKLKTMDRKIQGLEMQKLGAAPEWAVGSVHAVTEDGKILIASNTGSQLGSYAYSSAHVIWVVGTQKIVKDVDEGMKRIYEYCLPSETEKMMKLYNVSSNVSKLLIFNKEIRPGRVTMVLIKEKVGI